MKPLLEVAGLGVRFAAGGGLLGRRRWLTAVDDVGFRLSPGDSLGVVGESGCGKSTLARAVLGLVPVHEGRIVLDGERVDGAGRERLRALRRQAQMVFQDPRGSLDPRMPVGLSVAEPLEVFEPRMPPPTRRERVSEALRRVGLSPDDAAHYPHELSGGQCQRVGIARATILRPRLLVCDEPVSALDVSVQGQVVNLLNDLRRELGMTSLFISHNLAVVRQVSSNVLVMYLGRVMEHAGREALFGRPLHPYTQALMDAVPAPDPRAARRPVIGGDLPSPLDPPAGCAFHSRCPHAEERCARQRPVLEEAGPGRWVACHRWREWCDALPDGSGTVS